MGLAVEVYEQIRRYIWGDVDGDTVCDWLDEHAQEIHDAGDPDLRHLTDLTYSLLEDVFQEHRSDEEARAALQAALPGMGSFTTVATNRSAGSAGAGD